MEEYTDRMKRCYLCRTVIVGEVHIVKSIVPLTRFPEHAIIEEGVIPHILHAYPICAKCKEEKVLI